MRVYYGPCLILNHTHAVESCVSDRARLPAKVRSGQLRRSQNILHGVCGQCRGAHRQVCAAPEVCLSATNRGRGLLSMNCLQREAGAAGHNVRTCLAQQANLLRRHRRCDESMLRHWGLFRVRPRQRGTACERACESAPRALALPHERRFAVPERIPQTKAMPQEVCQMIAVAARSCVRLHVECLHMYWTTLAVCTVYPQLVASRAGLRDMQLRHCELLRTRTGAAAYCACASKLAFEHGESAR